MICPTMIGIQLFDKSEHRHPICIGLGRSIDCGLAYDPKVAVTITVFQMLYPIQNLVDISLSTHQGTQTQRLDKQTRKKGRDEIISTHYESHFQTSL